MAIWWYPCVELSLVLLEEAVYYNQCVLWKTFVSLCPVSFCTPRPNLPITPGISWLPTFAFQSSIMKRIFFFFLVLVLEAIIELHRTHQLWLLWHEWLGHRLRLLWCWMICLGNKPRSLCHFWGCTQVFQTLLLIVRAPKNDAVKVLHSICQQIWKTQQRPQDWKRSVFSPIPKKGNAKECSNYYKIALISHASKVMLKILQARLQQYMNHELPDVQAWFRKSRETRDQIANILWIIKKARVPEKHLLLLY